jgi:uncharacterized protein YjbI with pentapeptide repeats
MTDKEPKKITILNRYSGAEIFSIEGEDATVAKALLEAIKSGANLYGANLYGANLYGANLYGTDLYGTDLYGANLYGADLRGANLRGTNLCGTNLCGANLRGANLYGANLYGTDLYGANLYGANLRGAKIDGEEIKIAPLCIAGLHWWVLITDSYMRIGCQRHSHAEWAAFGNTQIAEMDGKAAEFWATWKAPLMAMCEQHANKAKESK